jgi:hypothetical protein
VVDSKPHVIMGADNMYLAGGQLREEVPFSLAGVKSLCHFLRIPPRIVKELGPAVSGTVLTTLLNKLQAYSITGAHGEIDVISQAKEVQHVDTRRVIDSIVQAMPDADFHRVLIGKEYDIQLEVVGERQAAVNVGDLVRGGVAVRFSPLGGIQPQVQTFALRLACTNGALTSQNLSGYELFEEDFDQFYPWLTQSVTTAYEGLESVMESWRILSQQVLSPEDRNLMLSGLMKRARLTSRMIEMIHGKALEEHPETAYDLLQLLTWATSHVMDDPRRIRRAQLAGAVFTDEVQHQAYCRSCRRAK